MRGTLHADSTRLHLAPFFAVSDATISEINPFIDDPEFTFESVDKASKACSGICLWVRAMHTYFNVAKGVEPKKAALAKAQETLDATMDALGVVKARLATVLVRAQHVYKLC